MGLEKLKVNPIAQSIKLADESLGQYRYRKISHKYSFAFMNSTTANFSQISDLAEKSSIPSLSRDSFQAS